MNKFLNKAVTTRFSAEEYLRLQSEAERRGCSIADVIRGAWMHYKEQKSLHQLLLKLEQRQRKVVFEMLCATMDLAADEKAQALDALRSGGVRF
jgi:hypothetical protein